MVDLVAEEARLAITSAARIASTIIQELSVQLREANERIRHLETKLLHASSYYDALQTIAGNYQTSEQLRMRAGQYGLSFEEEIEMAYENVREVARHTISASPGAQQPTKEHKMHDNQIKYMVDRFLGWRLPRDFNPDAGISYAPPSYADKIPPTGTNLLDATQAEAMIRYLIEGAPTIAIGDDDPIIRMAQSEADKFFAKEATADKACFMDGVRFALTAAPGVQQRAGEDGG